MAVGGALRAAIKAGNWASAARESRRRARALAQLNASGGIGNNTNRKGVYGAIDYLNRTGVEPAANQRFMDTGQMYAGDYNPAFESGRLFGYDMLGGRTAFMDPVTGARSTQAMNFGAPSPIQAPYEGVRTWPRGTESFFGLTGDMPAGNVAGPFMGRGVPNFRYRADGANPAIPRAFGGTFDWPASGAVSPPAPRPSRFFFDDYEISRNPFQSGETMPAWYRDEIMRGWQ